MPIKNNQIKQQLEVLINSPSSEEIFFLDQNNAMKYGALRASINKLSKILSSKKEIKRFAIVTNSIASVLVALCACLKTSKIPVLLPSTSYNFLTESIGYFDEILTDNEDPALNKFKSTVFARTQNFAHDHEEKVTFPEVLPDISLFTSGSSGESKRIRKKVSTMLQEGYLLKDFLFERYPDLMHSGMCIAASVTARHLYGLTFSVFLPLICKIRIYQQRIRFTEELVQLKDPLIFVSSPAFLKRIDCSLKPPRILLTVCAGGTLDEQDADEYITWSNSELLDIYGSTETGIIAYKIKNSHQKGWTLFKGMRLTPSNFNFTLSSELLDGELTVSDHITLLEDGSFILKGRSDDIVKIEEKRISLNEIKQSLLKLPGIKDAECIPYIHKKRTFIAALIILDPPTRRLFEENRTGMIINWRKKLLFSLIETAVPRKFTIIDTFYENENGKRPRAMLERLLLEKRNERKLV
ncbi:MAG: hypothetical protein MR571_01235 [Succinatimonas sp.]|nr:hypothetical protein [Succinatimonas sp.]